ncbi:hypothetical protein JCM24511_03592 [Saitozyma sp. JCM 24511]|nr:hypothetical protein JCM24511_03592 [Saitozyma sp. JCM 24511]
MGSPIPEVDAEKQLHEEKLLCRPGQGYLRPCSEADDGKGQRYMTEENLGLDDRFSGKNVMEARGRRCTLSKEMIAQRREDEYEGDNKTMPTGKSFRAT